ncbi:MAG: hypothetical protein K1X64_02150 [Myxococcaceae bacterium]|nr:hypothetical protein [Myxococcaceae bacterium]
MVISLEGFRSVAVLGAALLMSSCASERLTTASADFHLEPGQLSFPATPVGTQAAQQLRLINDGVVPHDVTLSVAAPFSVEPSKVTVSGGREALVTVHFAPTALGDVSGTLTLTLDGVEAPLPLVGKGSPSLGCQALVDGTWCDDVCLTTGVCRAGVCVGQPLACDDGNACTLNACEPGVGCVFPPAPPPAELDGACTVASCDAARGWFNLELPDGTACGTRECARAHICLAGRCEERPTPNAPFCTSMTLSSSAVGTCALSADSHVSCWGGWNQLFLSPSSSVVPIPQRLPGVSNVAGISTRWWHACLVTHDGAAQCWGDNSWGQLGVAPTGAPLGLVDVPGLSSGVLFVDVGNIHSCALLKTGAVKCWGHNGDGQIGGGTSGLIVAPTDVPGLQRGVRSLSVGGNHACALLDDGRVKCWGSNANQQAGPGEGLEPVTPQPIPGLEPEITALAAGDTHTCALSRNGSVQCWGLRQLGNASGAEGRQGATWPPHTVLAKGSGAVALSAGEWASCAVLKSGEVRCWGRDFSQQPSMGETFSAVPVKVAGVSDAVSVSVGAHHACALLSNGKVQCWGSNINGQLGRGTVGGVGVNAAEVTGL